MSTELWSKNRGKKKKGSGMGHDTIKKTERTESSTRNLENTTFRSCPAKYMDCFK